MCSSLIYYNLVARWTLEVNEAIGVLLYIISLSLNICDNTYYCITIKMMTSFESYIHSLPCGLPLWNKKGVFVVIGSRLPFYPPSQRLPSLFLLPDDNPTTAGMRTTFGFRFGDHVLHQKVSRPPMVCSRKNEWKIFSSWFTPWNRLKKHKLIHLYYNEKNMLFVRLSVNILYFPLFLEYYFKLTLK